MLYGIQYLRGIAALMVVFHHALYRQQTYGRGDFVLELEFGAGGVDVFFLISGFIMYYVTTERPVGAIEFLKARIVRIVPNYWFWTLVFALCFFGETNWVHIITSLFFIPSHHPNFTADTLHIWPTIIQGWTLNYEMFFYVLFAVGLLVRQRLLLTTAAIVGLVVASGYFTPIEPVLNIYTNPLLTEFLVGMWIGVWFFSYTTPSRLVGYWLIGLGLVLFCIFEFVTLANIGFHGAWILDRGLPSFFVVAGVLVVEKSHPLPYWGVPALLGAASYTIYLSHVIFLEWIGQLWRYLGLNEILPDAVFLPLMIGLSIFLGVVCYWLIERPLVGWFKPRKTPTHDSRPEGISP